MPESVKNFFLEFMTNATNTPKLNHDETLNLIDKYESYTKRTYQGDFGKTTQYIVTYIELVNLYHTLDKSIRTGNIHLYIYALCRISNFFLAFNHQNYSHWVLYYISNLRNIDETHPGLRSELEKGAFGVRRTEKSFSRISVDLTLEQTINGETTRRLVGILNITN